MKVIHFYDKQKKYILVEMVLILFGGIEGKITKKQNNKIL